MVVHLEEKTRIAQFVAQLVHDGESLMIDGGSTTILVARELCQKKHLLVVTNSPSIGEMMIDSNDNKVIMTGGELMKETYSLTGSKAEYSLSEYRTDKAIIGVSGMIPEEGCFSAIPQEAEIKRLMSINSRETIVVADSSKLDTRAFCFFCDFSSVDKLVTDRNLGKSALDTLKQKGVEVFTV
jgi:DeoR family transcriptional regulator, fructose operon transcriptional repressor